MANTGYQRATEITLNYGNTSKVYSLLDSFNAANAVKYGFLYNWYATQDQGGGVYLVSEDMRAEGWDVPTNTDFNTLITHLGGTSVSGGKLKETGFTYWNSPNEAATNEVAYNLKGSGVRQYNDGVFSAIKIYGILWSKSVSSFDGIYYILGRYEFSISSNSPGNKKWGFAIRPVRTATAAEQLLPDGLLTDTYYYGNDGKIYRVTKIGTQVWVADNLDETKFSDGSWIAGYDGGTYTPIANATWAALTTAALCAYGDDETKVMGISVAAITSAALAALSNAEYANRVYSFLEYIKETEGFDIRTYITNSERVENTTACPLPDLEYSVEITWTDANIDADDGLGGSVKLLSSTDVETDSESLTIFSKLELKTLSGAYDANGYKVNFGSIVGYVEGVAVVTYIRWSLDGVTWTESNETALYTENTSIQVEVQTIPFA
jgi:uncharacterized protein (TIGR02145 family)